MEYLGFILSKDGISTDPTKITTVLDWPQPQNIKQVQGFLGLIGWYHIFIEGYEKIASALAKILKKSPSFKWIEEAQQSFDNLRQALVTAPVFALPDFSKTFIVTSDASALTIDDVLQK